MLTLLLPVRTRGAHLWALRARRDRRGVTLRALASLDQATLARLEHDLARLIEVLAADPANAQVPLAHL